MAACDSATTHISDCECSTVCFAHNSSLKHLTACKGAFWFPQGAVYGFFGSHFLKGSDVSSGTFQQDFLAGNGEAETFLICTCSGWAGIGEFCTGIEELC